MSPAQIVVQGTLKPDGTLELDERPNLPPGRVRVTLVADAPAPGRAEDVWALLDRIRKEREALGLKGRTREEIDADLNAMRDEWDERAAELDRIREAGKGEGQGGPGC
jgi:hypothetical protein